jgi:hypothetical protein
MASPSNNFNFLLLTLAILIAWKINYVKLDTVVNNFVCTDEFCEKYKEDNPCEPLADACLVQNTTFNGIIFPSATPCSCCEVCVENLKLGDYCTTGQIGAPIPTQICGAGLTCFLSGSDDHAKCITMTTGICTFALQEYQAKRDAGELGMLMLSPSCDAEGMFNPIQCIPGQICYCVDRVGNRIFGEAIHHANSEFVMKCECARLAASFDEIIDSKFPKFTARCNEAGSYDVIQCFGDKCLCVDENNGSPTSSIYNLTMGIDTMKCFDRRLHQNVTYLRECEVDKMKRISEIKEYIDEGIRIITEDYDYCQPDGYYARIQKNHTHVFCSDRFGKPIEPYILERSDERANTMNCNCARVVELMERNKITIEIPKCCPNGNYEELACRRGLCYCVDENGQQTTVEVSSSMRDTLPCKTCDAISEILDQ